MAANRPKESVFDGDEDLARAATFDFIVGHSDRHYGNWMLHENPQDKHYSKDKLVLIDNGLSFPTHHNPHDWPNALFWHRAIDRKLPIPDVSKFAPWPEIARALEADGIEPAAIELTRLRYELVTSGDYKTIAELPAAPYGDTEKPLRDYRPGNQPLLKAVSEQPKEKKPKG